ncbi:MAG: hypothetical protein IJ439_03595 [Tyzzerella sp.]|nr:hypothetical protein [Tyzzerella sp.]
MSKVKVILNKEGVRELLRSNEMMAICEEHANKALGQLGEGYIVTTMTGQNRVNASIYAESYEAKKENMEHNTILKALR